MKKLAAARVAVFGIGGVGGHCVEALARSGVGKFVLVDRDTVSITNLNRQIIALHSTVGLAKVEVMKARIADINPNAEVRAVREFFLPETAERFDFSEYDTVVDAVDTVTAKIEIVLRANAAGVPVVSCMGAGNKSDPARFQLADLSETSVCPLARVMRRELRARGIEHLQVVYSREEPKKCGAGVPASLAFVPSVAGLLLASAVVRGICGDPHGQNG